MPEPVFSFCLYMTAEDDEQRWSELMRLAQQGDEEAYRQLLQELSKVISAYLYRQFGPVGFVDDCVQETLIAIHSARHTYQSNRPFKPWMNAIIKYKTIDLLRKQNRHSVFSASNDSEYTGNSSQLQQSSHERAIDTVKQIEAELSSAKILKQLPEKHRKVLILTKLLGFTIDEASENLAISPGAVKQQVRRAIAKTRQLLKGDSV